MRRATLVLTIACALPACTDDELPPIEFAELCGVRGPVKLVDLAPDEYASTLEFAGRLYYTVHRRDADGESHLDPGGLWSTDLCGGSPQLIAADIARPQTLERYPGVLFGDREGVGLFSLDPAGVDPPHLVIPTDRRVWNLKWTEHGVLEARAHEDDEDLAAVVLYSIPADPRRDTAVPEVLIDPIDVRTLSYGPDAIHYRTPDGTLVRLDLANRGLTPVQTHVHGYRWSSDMRYLLWQDATPTGGTVDSPTGIVNLRDETTGNSTALGDATDSLGNYDLSWSALGYLLAKEQQVPRIYRLPGLDFIDLPTDGQRFFQGPLPDGRWLIGGVGPPWLSVFDLEVGNVTPLFQDEGQILGSDADSLMVLAVPNCCNPYEEMGELWRVPFDGSRAQLLADRATYQSRRLDATRLLTSVDITSDRIMNLVLVDLETRREQLVAEGVTGWYFGADGDTTLLTYIVNDGPRSGLWRVRLP